MNLMTSKFVIDDVLWDNYFSIGVNRVQAMANLWDDYQNGMLFPWAGEEYGITENELLASIARLTTALVGADLTEVAGMKSVPSKG